jgi:hypothetical protein
MLNLLREFCISLHVNSYKDTQFGTLLYNVHVKWVLYHHSMVWPQVVDGGYGLQIWRIAVNILNKQSWTAERGWPSSLGVG